MAHSTTSLAPRRRAGVVALALAALLGVAACGGETPAEVITPDPVTVTPEIVEDRVAAPEAEMPIVWPLTGVPVEEVPARPSVSVKIENTSAARPQAGLEMADVVWENIVEFEVSRFIAVFHSQIPDEVGPIRSVRPVDPVVVAPLKGLLAYSGGQPGILQLVYNSPSQSVAHDAGAAGMYRVSHRSAPHNVYGSIEAFINQANADHQLAPERQFGFAADAVLASAVVSGTPATNLNFRLSGASNPAWDWDEATGTWLRSEGSSPATVASGARISAVNVVAITAEHPNTGFGAQNGALVPTYNLVGEGEAVVATGGRTIAGTWKKAGEADPLRVYAADGTELLLAPGNTWVEMIPAGKGSLTIG